MYFKNPEKRKEIISCVVELGVEMININFGHNRQILERCKPLYEYSFLVDRIRNNIEELKKEGKDFKLEDAVDRAIEEIPKDFKILKFIMKNRMEVKDMCLFEYDEEKHMRYEREEGRREGKIENMIELVHEGLLEKKIVAEKLGITVEEVETKLKEKYK